MSVRRHPDRDAICSLTNRYTPFCKRRICVYGELCHDAGLGTGEMVEKSAMRAKVFLKQFDIRPVMFEGVGDVLGLIDSRFADVGFVVGIVVNIHHYYVDGSVWKMSNPRVRAELFAHLRR